MFATKEQAQQACLELKSLLRDKYTMKVDGDIYVFISPTRSQLIYGSEIVKIADYCKAHGHGFTVSGFDELTVTIY